MLHLRLIHLIVFSLVFPSFLFSQPKATPTPTNTPSAYKKVCDPRGTETCIQIPISNYGYTWCDKNEDCKNLKCKPDEKTCVQNGTGQTCSSNSDCVSVKRCGIDINGNAFCSTTGTGGSCDSANECQISSCDGARCVQGLSKFGSLCNSNEDCSQKRCDPSTRLCVNGGISNVSCSQDSDCPKEKACVPNYSQCNFSPWPQFIRCENASDCSGKVCTKDRVCVTPDDIANGQYGLCNSDSDCKSVPTFCSKGMCEPNIMGITLGLPRCNKNADCDGIKQCAFDMSAEGPTNFRCEVGGTGTSCKLNSQCYHKSCVSIGFPPVGYCKEAFGPGIDSCSQDSECNTKQCAMGYTGELQCQSLPGVGDDECTSNSECGHKECEDGFCKSVRGSGSNTCSKDSECGHKECEDFQCTHVEEPGEDKCSEDSQCGHRECVDGSCSYVEGTNQKDKCIMDSQCGHLECSGRSCVSVEPAGVPGTCNEDEDCKHSVCENWGCKDKDGPGTSNCYSNLDCLGVGTPLPTPIITVTVDRHIQALKSLDMFQQPQLVQSHEMPSAKVQGILLKFPEQPFIGKKNAPVQMVGFFDLTCGMCAKFVRDSFSTIQRQYIDTGLVRFDIYSFPLGNDRVATQLAEGLYCAAKQDKEIEFLKYTSNEIKSLSSNSIHEIDEKLGLDRSSFRKCLRSEDVQTSVQSSIQAARALGVNGTPHFFINGIKLLGAQPVSIFQKTIDSELVRLNLSKKSVTKQSEIEY